MLRTIEDPSEGVMDLVREKALLAEARARVAASAGALQRQLTQATDWRAWIRREPAIALAIAIGLGWLVGRRRS